MKRIAVGKGQKFEVQVALVAGGCQYRWGYWGEMKCERRWVVVARGDGAPLNDRQLCPFHEGGMWGEMRAPRGVLNGVVMGEREYERAFKALYPQG